MTLTLLNSSTSIVTCPTRGPDAPFYRWLAFGYTLLFILALTANLRVLFKLSNYTRRRFRDHILLLNLCAADLFVTLVYIPSEIYAYTIGRWYNDNICKTIAALKALGIYVSSCSIIGISLDRYLSIVHPLTVYQSNTRNQLLVAGSWLISAIACVPQLIIFKRLTNEELCREMCGDILSSDPVKRLTYNVAVALFAYVAPLLTITYSYCRILYVLQRRCDRRTFRFSKSNENSISEINHSNTPLKSTLTKRSSSKRIRTAAGQEEINTHNMKTMTRAKLKTLKVTALIVICFILCWTPYYCIVFFLLITDARMDNENPNLLSTTTTTTISNNLSSSYQQQTHEPSRDERSLLIVMMLAVSNSVFDPMIYGCFLVRHFKSSCIRRKRNEMTTTLRRGACPLVIDKESKSTIVRMNMKNGHVAQRTGGGGDAIECHL